MMYFRVLKQTQDSPLLSSVLKGLAKLMSQIRVLVNINVATIIISQNFIWKVYDYYDILYKSE